MHNDQICGMMSIILRINRPTESYRIERLVCRPKSSFTSQKGIHPSVSPLVHPSSIRSIGQSVCLAITPVDTNNLYKICTMLDQRRRRWADIVQMLYKCFVFILPDLPYSMNKRCLLIWILTDLAAACDISSLSAVYIIWSDWVFPLLSSPFMFKELCMWVTV